MQKPKTVVYWFSQQSTLDFVFLLLLKYLYIYVLV